MGSGTRQVARMDTCRSGNRRPWRSSIKFQNRLKESSHTNDEDVITEKVEPDLRDLVAHEFSTLIEESLDDILHKSLQNA